MRVEKVASVKTEVPERFRDGESTAAENMADYAQLFNQTSAPGKKDEEKTNAFRPTSTRVFKIMMIQMVNGH